MITAEAGFSATLLPDPSLMGLGYKHPGSIREGRNGVDLTVFEYNPFSF